MMWQMTWWRELLTWTRKIMTWWRQMLTGHALSAVLIWWKKDDNVFVDGRIDIAMLERTLSRTWTCLSRHQKWHTAWTVSSVALYITISGTLHDTLRCWLACTVSLTERSGAYHMGLNTVVLAVVADINVASIFDTLVAENIVFVFWTSTWMSCYLPQSTCSAVQYSQTSIVNRVVHSHVVLDSALSAHSSRKACASNMLQLLCRRQCLRAYYP